MEIRYYSQPNGFSCGNTALKMVSTLYPYLKDISIDELIIAMGSNPQTGTTDVNMKIGLDYLGLDYNRFDLGNRESSFSILEESIKNNNPILIRGLVNGIKHWIVIFGKTNNTYNCYDSWLGKYQLTKKQLEEIWEPRDYDGFVVYGKKKITVKNYSIVKINPSELNEVLHLAATIFSSHMDYKDNLKYIKKYSDISLSHKLLVNGELAGFYFVRQLTVRRKVLIGSKGLEGIALGVKPKFRGLGLGEILKDWLEKYAIDLGLKFVYGKHLDTLNNKKEWLKRRNILDDNPGLFTTYKIL